eukprot:TRINITY_DN5660_c0_g1_i1.p1 TRINITY_DN5660_c0_g1~~TRINITY_DN5660_c0_g1_i1.p1  ORF type:complete len:382 (+),score=37.88 TRINITY_DN5660_c0_g1_i1:325-1470(+)
MAEPGVDDLKKKVFRVLKSRGIIGRLKADLRTSVLSVLQSNDPAHPLYSPNQRLASFATTTEGQAALALVLDLLTQYELKSTLSVLAAESAGIFPGTLPSAAPSVVHNETLSSAAPVTDTAAALTSAAADRKKLANMVGLTEAPAAGQPVLAALLARDPSVAAAVSDVSTAKRVRTPSSSPSSASASLGTAKESGALPEEPAADAAGADDGYASSFDTNGEAKSSKGKVSPSSSRKSSKASTSSSRKSSRRASDASAVSSSGFSTSSSSSKMSSKSSASTKSSSSSSSSQASSHHASPLKADDKPVTSAADAAAALQGESPTKQPSDSRTQGESAREGSPTSSRFTTPFSDHSVASSDRLSACDAVEDADLSDKSSGSDDR